jgi:hypothetical protein
MRFVHASPFFFCPAGGGIGNHDLERTFDLERRCKCLRSILGTHWQGFQNSMGCRETKSLTGTTDKHL